MLDFKPTKVTDKEKYEAYLALSSQRGCNFSFANVYLWGEQKLCEFEGCMLTFSRFGKHFVYPYPLGSGDKKKCIEAIIDDAGERGIPCRFSGLLEKECAELENMFPGKFVIKCNRDSSDYVYNITDLATLRGKKYHSKRNHLNRFYAAHPDIMLEPLHSGNLDKVKAMTKKWFESREVPDDDSFTLEKQALERVFESYEELELESLVIIENGEVLAFTLASRMSDSIFDVHFEKARMDIDGAYTAINHEFAKYINAKYPEVHYLNREEDMGLEGLRKAKLSYYPEFMIEKCSAVLK